MTDRALSPPSRLADRWPSALAALVIAGALATIVLSDREGELFGPAVATMAGIYLMAYAIGRPWTAWLAFAVLSAVVTLLNLLPRLDLPSVDPAVGMTVALVPLWLVAVARRRFADVGTFSIQTAGMVLFGLITLLTAAAEPRVAVALAGFGILAHGLWDAYHFKQNRVVNRSWAEFCCVVDLAVGAALVVTSVS